jgi:hypothetical protein
MTTRVKKLKAPKCSSCVLQKEVQRHNAEMERQREEVRLQREEAKLQREERIRAQQEHARAQTEMWDRHIEMGSMYMGYLRDVMLGRVVSEPPSGPMARGAARIESRRRDAVDDADVPPSRRRKGSLLQIPND